MNNDNQQQGQLQTVSTAQEPAKPQHHELEALMERPKKSKWGLTGKTFWDWLQLLIVPVMLVSITVGFSMQQSNQQNAISQQQHENDQNLALDQQRQTTLTTYMDDIKNLLLNQNLRGSKQGDEVSVVARAETLTALRQLDGTREGLLIRFLSEAGLVEGKNAVISLSGADLSHMDLRGADLGGANLIYADLSNSDLRGTHLSGADLVSADLSGANLSGTALSGTDLISANLTGANLSGADLCGAQITQEQLAQAFSLKSTTKPDCSTHP